MKSKNRSLTFIYERWTSVDIGLLILFIGGSRFIASSSTPSLFCWTLSFVARFRLFSSPGWRRESEQTWISSAIDCLPYNSSFYSSRRVHRWIWISTMRPATFYHLAAATVGRIFISSSGSSLLFSFDLFRERAGWFNEWLRRSFFPASM